MTKTRRLPITSKIRRNVPVRSRVWKPLAEQLEARMLLAIDFAPPVDYSIGSTPRSVAVGDFNEDGMPDMAVTGARGNSGDISVFLNQGDGTFGAPSELTLGASHERIVTADLNHDGKLDLVTANSYAGVGVFLGHGDGTFGQVTFYGDFSYPLLVVPTDINGDGNVDLTIADLSRSGIQVLPGAGDGSFGPGTTIPVGESNSAVAIGDLDGDSIPDLVDGEYGGGGMHIAYGTGGGDFGTTTTYLGGSGLNGISIGDLNEDGLPDIVGSDQFSNDLVVVINQGDRTFSQPTILKLDSGANGGAAIVDLDGDGHVDLAVATYGGVRVLRGHGDAQFDAPQAFTAGESPGVLRAADFDGDGDPDLAVVNVYSQDVSILDNVSGPSPGKLGLGASSYQTPENGPALAVTVTRQGGSTGAVSVSYSTEAGTASPGGDYAPVSGTVAFADGETGPKTILIPILDDNLAEPGAPETFTINLAGPTGGARLGANSSALVQIQDDETRLSADAPISPITALAGTPTANLLLATFHNSFDGPPPGPYTATIDWGDGSAPEDANFLVSGPTIYVVGSHAYRDPGTFRGAVTLGLPDVSPATSTFTANVASPVIDGRVLGATENHLLARVAVATSPDRLDPDLYTATIDWGDGTPTSRGTIRVDDSSGTSVILGDHIYEESGHYTVVVALGTVANGALATGTGAADIADVPIQLAGELDTASDTGSSQSDNITSDNTPTFRGTSEPGSTVSVFAQPALGTSSQFLIGSTVAGADGTWAITPDAALPDDVYTIYARAVDRAGVTTAGVQLVPVNGERALVIDTTRPVLDDVTLDRRTGRIVVRVHDDRSGVFQPSPQTVVSSLMAMTGRGAVVDLSASTPSGPGTPQLVTYGVVSKRFFRAIVRIQLQTSGFRDVAGNALDTGRGADGSSDVELRRLLPRGRFVHFARIPRVAPHAQSHVRRAGV